MSFGFCSRGLWHFFLAGLERKESFVISFCLFPLGHSISSEIKRKKRYQGPYWYLLSSCLIKVKKITECLWIRFLHSKNLRSQSLYLELLLRESQRILFEISENIQARWMFHSSFILFFKRKLLRRHCNFLHKTLIFFVIKKWLKRTYLKNKNCNVNWEISGCAFLIVKQL